MLRDLVNYPRLLPHTRRGLADTPTPWGQFGVTLGVDWWILLDRFNDVSLENKGLLVVDGDCSNKLML
ncbi:MAG: hypothetical protein OSB66_10020 [SAR202 cluster bacterium]|nr:hypothetical protein [SAR202 cluster bacterium]